MLVCVKERRNLSVFAGNCLLWDHIQKNNGSSVFLLNQLLLLWLTLDSGNWNSQCSEATSPQQWKYEKKSHDHIKLYAFQLVHQTSERRVLGSNQKKHGRCSWSTGTCQVPCRGTLEHGIQPQISLYWTCIMNLYICIRAVWSLWLSSDLHQHLSVP